MRREGTMSLEGAHDMRREEAMTKEGGKWV